MVSLNQPEEVAARRFDAALPQGGAGVPSNLLEPESGCAWAHAHADPSLFETVVLDVVGGPQFQAASRTRLLRNHLLSGAAEVSAELCPCVAICATRSESAGGRGCGPPLHLQLARAVGRQAQVEDFSVGQAQAGSPSRPRWRGWP